MVKIKNSFVCNDEFRGIKINTILPFLTLICTIIYLYKVHLLCRKKYQFYANFYSRSYLCTSKEKIVNYQAFFTFKSQLGYDRFLRGATTKNPLEWYFMKQTLPWSLNVISWTSGKTSSLTFWTGPRKFHPAFVPSLACVCRFFF